MEIPLLLQKLIGPYIARSRELSHVDPVISYFCQLYAAETILEHGLHLTSNEVASYAAHILDDIEAVKAELGQVEAANSMLNDKLLAHAYVDAFAFKVFHKADTEVREQRSSKATVATFMSSTVFYTVSGMFKVGDEAEIAAKVKYAKFHASRIMKAFREGRDPNDYKVETSEIRHTPELFDSKAARPGGRESEPEDDVPEAHENEHDFKAVGSGFARDVVNISHPESLISTFTDRPAQPAIPKFLDSDDETVSVFPAAPTEPAKTVIPTFLESDEEEPIPVISKAEPLGQPAQLKNVKEILSLDEAITKAQKHSKYAISALNYEDVPTGIKELESALALLRALEK
ncbi:hypothetical protein BABINDRAFT_7707 [Babjeviella inositovora NRRL Y-12698]|uniref:Vta1 C-terminal domain-containing protein n=1 Tax=Babjeviella inositovora NRRL Y-12698 TaxID=984486 RepID=A0A1E3QRI4_9ASCO|nr:uncharacterized protein BABINDRAFT_7707 [Babjeviella inositovora NRRL Y-12698]ODQ80248.1 hypothetical protein BABINDRAFT_7707 [Babjeviella inositovora NRRL Y-12698]